jgi:hypothetical protein
MSDIGTTKFIPLTDLVVDFENYRLGPQPGQNETIQAMIEEQGEKLAVLAKDILEFGLSPFDLLMVCPTDKEGVYRVIEGNRRVTALKILHQPALAHGVPIEKAISDLVRKHDGKLLDQCRCVVVKDKEEGYRWIERKHAIGLEGAGTEGWGAIAIRRAQAAQGKPQISLQVLDYVKRNAKLSQKDLEQIDHHKFPVTNLERILEDKDSMDDLGLSVQNGEIVASKSPEWTLNMLSQIVKDVASKAKRVGDIFDKAKRDKYIKDLSGNQKAVAPTNKSWSLTSGAAIKTAAGSMTTGRRVPLSTERKTIVPKGHKLKITHTRINKIYDELRKLKVDDLPNAGAVLFRVFIELSGDEYAARNPGIGIKPDDKLVSKLTAIANYMESNAVLTKAQLKPLRVALGRQHDVLSTNTLNAYVHSAQIIPRADDLKSAWDSIEPFVAKLW